MQKDFSNGNGLFSVIKGVAFALLASVLFSILFACVLRAAPALANVVYPVNQIVKVLAAFLGGLFFVRGEKGWLKGLGVGGLFFLLSYLTFSAFGGNFSASWLILVECIVTVLGGIIGGIFGVNLRR
ncbi:MAG: TIGR04086 family membrane protein [Clostridia bacterium]|nr:TIGR04086 family membrane protein [Clostridia bacterium]